MFSYSTFARNDNASNYSSYARALATAFISVSLINLGSLLVFDVILGGLHLKIPRLLRDTAVILTYVLQHL